MPVVATGRKHVSELVKGINAFRDDTGLNYNYASVSAEGAAAVDPIGTLLKWNDTDSAFKPLEAEIPADWVALTVYAVGDQVKPTTRSGKTHTCVAGGTSGASEPTFNTQNGGETTDATVTWITNDSYAPEIGSTLPDNSAICISVGSQEGVGFNKADVTLSATPVTLTVLFRGPAGISTDGIEFGTISAADQAEIKNQFERQGIAVSDPAEVVVPSFVS